MPMVKLAAIRYSMFPKSGHPVSRLREGPAKESKLSLYASAGEGRSDKIMLKQNNAANS
jgi:hypothetical protein